MAGMGDYKKRFADDPEDVHALAAGLRDVLRVYKDVKGQNADWIYDGMMLHLKSKPRTRIQNRNLGLFVALLIAHGASLNQVALAFKDWDGTSVSSIKRGYYPIRDEFRLPKDERSLKNSKFVSEAMFMVYLFENQIGKSFPGTSDMRMPIRPFIRQKHSRKRKFRTPLI